MADFTRISAGPDYAHGSSHAGDPHSYAPWSQTLRAAWLLMNQPNITEPEDLDRARASARRDERDGYTTGPIRLIHLRRQTHDATCRPRGRPRLHLPLAGPVTMTSPTSSQPSDLQATRKRRAYPTRVPACEPCAKLLVGDS